MKITLIQKPYRQILMRIEVDTVCTKIDISSVFSPFKEMYTWLGRIRDRQLPAEMTIDEEGYGVVLIAKEIAENNIEFTVKGWLRNEDTIYLQTVIDHNTLVESFHNEIVSFIEEQVKETEPSFIVNYENLNWNSLLTQSDKTQDWNKRLAIYGGAKGKHRKTNLDNFSLTVKQEYLIKLRDGIQEISRISFRRRKKALGELVSFYQELAIDVALDAIDRDWYVLQKEKLNDKYQLESCLKGRTGKERIKERNKQINLRQTRLKTLEIGQVVDGTIVGLRPYGAFIDLGGISALMHISKISQLPVEDPQQVFKVGDWVRAIIVYLDVEKYRVALSTKDLETEPGQIFTEPWIVYQNAEMMAMNIDKQ